MDRRKIEQFTASLAVMLLFVITIGSIIFFADQFFRWDIFPPHVETFLGFLLVSCIAVIFSSVLVNVMLNLSLLAINSDLFIESLRKSAKGGGRDDK